MTNNKKMNMNHRFSIKRFLAFTMVEVLVVLIVLSALALILLPRMINLVPDDHAKKYKKAFYGMQQMIEDIIKDPEVCQGLREDGFFNWVDPGDDANALTVCMRVDGTGRPLEGASLHSLMYKRYSFINANSRSRTNFIDASGVRWNIPAVTLDETFEDNATIYVSLDAKDFPSTLATNAADGIYGITISPDGRVMPATAVERALLSSNP